MLWIVKFLGQMVESGMNGDASVDEFVLLVLPDFNPDGKILVCISSSIEEFLLYAKTDKNPQKNHWCSWYHVLIPKGLFDQCSARPFCIWIYTLLWLTSVDELVCLAIHGYSLEVKLSLAERCL